MNSVAARQRRLGLIHSLGVEGPHEAPSRTSRSMIGIEGASRMSSPKSTIHEVGSSTASASTQCGGSGRLRNPSSGPSAPLPELAAIASPAVRRRVLPGELAIVVALPARKITALDRNQPTHSPPVEPLYDVDLPVVDHGVYRAVFAWTLSSRSKTRRARAGPVAPLTFDDEGILRYLKPSTTLAEFNGCRVTTNVPTAGVSPLLLS